ncbi:Alpha/Beta hydrolase protein [Collybia nuda]|uniref:Carboxylic ester hydrolase n=1 Tax=Collybia nuda TaxID=64659 RepID=A0A9P5Y160_9AGAR|nr:Alpha/Beta hydrolase protein [Collybia nuda]
MHLSISFVVIVGFVFQGRGVSADDVIDTGYVKYQGNRTFSNAVAYLGIPYAEPPTGQRRFRAPLPLNTTRITLTQAMNGNVVDATKYPDFCIQGPIGTEQGGAGSEDCLKVNIYTPVGAHEGSDFPVLVYFHGGGFTFGNPRSWPFDHWVQENPNVIIVSVYYRLSSFGFMAVPEFRDSSLGDFNAGLQDQIQALRWVNKYISRFGGDASKVTINGQSSGGGSVQLHLLFTDIREALFRSAIAQSAPRRPVPTPEQQKPLFDFYAQKAGCGAGSVETKLACLRSASVSTLARAQEASLASTYTATPYKSFQPILDGVIITNHPTPALKAGHYARIPFIIGSTTNETLVGGPDIPSAWKKFCPGIIDEDVDNLLALYPSPDFVAEALRQQTAAGDFSIRCTRTIMASEYSKNVPTWTYRYNQRDPTNPSLGVEHAAENWLMFLGSTISFNGSVTFTGLTPTENSFASELIAYWLSFVRTGNPNTHKLSRSPVWNGYNETLRYRNVLQQDPAGSTTRTGIFLEQEVNLEIERCTVAGSQTSQEN